MALDNARSLVFHPGDSQGNPREDSMIKSIRIKNFRSIENMIINCDRLTMFVGPNDAGKSNILRALNLFFNGQTDLGRAFDFDRDFNKFASVPQRKAREVKVTLEFEIPRNYNRADKHSGIVRWSKTWRSDRTIFDDPEYYNRQVIEPLSRIPAWLDKIQFHYVPAIKDQNYFSELQGLIFDMLSDFSVKVQKSSREFEADIGEQVSDLLSALGGALGGDYRMQFAGNLRLLFEKLQFTNENNIPFDRRGDGIKVRHIPTILAFIADQRDFRAPKRSLKSMTVWGLEEPENNLELSSCYEVASEIISKTNNSRRQTFLTTHSPAFYKPLSPPPSFSIMRHYIRKSEENNKLSILKGIDDEATDSDMGLTQLVAPIIAQMETELQELKDLAGEMRKDMRDLGKPHMFIEGETDKMVIGKALNIFFRDDLDRFDISHHGGINLVAKQLDAWELIQSSQENRFRGVALVDRDNPEGDFKSLLSKNQRKNTEMIKWGKPTPGHLTSIFQRGFIIPIDLEAMYSDEFWMFAEQVGWLEDCTAMLNRLPRKIVGAWCNQLENRINPYADLSNPNFLRVRKQFSKNGKMQAAKHISKLPAEKARKILEHMQSDLKKGIDYLLEGNQK